jgi:hypothetical protein
MMQDHIYKKFADQELLWFASDSEDTYATNLKNNYDSIKPWINCNLSYKFNSHGFRCNNFSDKPSAVILGCSITFGVGLPIETTWSRVVADQIGLECYNLSILAGANDTAFRLAYYWLEKIKPKMVLVLSPDPSRIELLTPNGEILYNPNKSLSPIGQDFYKQWLTDDNNSLLNQKKNLMAIEYLCNQLNIKFLVEDSYPIVDVARDLKYPGIATHKVLAEKFLNRI